MYKKVLSLTVCLALTIGLFGICANAADEGFVFSQDFQDNDFTEMAIPVGGGAVQVIEDANGNSLVDIDGYSDNYSGVVDTMITPAMRGSKYTVQFDVNAIDVSGPLCFVIKNTDLSVKWQGVNIFPASFAPVTKETTGLVNDGFGEWYTLRITVDETKYKADNDIGSVFGIQIRKVGEEKWTTLSNPGGTYVEKVGFRPRTAGDNHIRLVPSTGNMAIGVSRNAQNSFSTNTPHYQIDNVTVFTNDKTVVSGAWFRDSSNEIINSVPDGEVTAYFNVNNYGGADSATVVFAAYGENGEFITMSTADVSLGANNTNVFANFDAEGLNCRRLEAFLCVSDSLVPIRGIRGTLGKCEEIEKSVTTANLGTDGLDGEYVFSAFDRCTLVNKVTVEGEHQKGEITPITVEAKGKTTGDTLYFRQFNSKTDGTFKVTFAIAPEVCPNDDAAIITVSSADTKSKSFEVPVFSNWESMIGDFESIEDATEMQNFIDTYYENLSRFEAGIEEITEVDIADISYSEMAFIRSMNTYESVDGYEAVVDAVLGLIADTRSAEKFVEDFKTAQKLEGEHEKIDAIRELLTECKIIEFSTVGASNVDAICKALITSEASSLEEIYADFYNAYTTQKNAEESTVPGFTSITCGADVKQFFIENEVVLGVDPKKYTDIDYKVMYSVYQEKNYESLVSYEEVNGAIVFLDNYICEYNQFLKLMENAALVMKNPATIKGLLNNSYTYIEIELADGSAVVNEDYLYNRLIGMDCASLDAIEQAFADAVDAQIKYEIAAKDALITIMDEASVKSYFAEYADMLGVPDAKNYTDAELAVFVEVYEKFRPTATNYPEAHEQTIELIEQHKKAMKLVSDINAKAKTKDWSAIKAVYEGDVCREFIEIDTLAEGVKDIRAMYMRIVNNAPVATLESVKSVWEKAYSEQLGYEEIAGGYETFDDELAYFDESAWKLDVQGNVVTVSGKVDAKGQRYITLYAESGENLIYIKQTLTKATGEFEVRFILNPELYGDGEKAVLHICGDSLNLYTFGEFVLYSQDELQAMVDGFLEIDSEAEMKAYIKEYSEELNLEVDVEDDRIAEALFFLYEKEKAEGKYDAISDVDEVLGSAEKAGMISIMVQMDEMLACLENLTEYANKKVGNTLGQWKKIKDEVQKAIKNDWIDPETSGRISDEASLYLRMAGKNYNYMKDVESEYEDAYYEQHKAESKENNKKPSSGGGGGGGSFGGGGNAGSGSKLPIESVSGNDEGKQDILGIGTDYLVQNNDPALNQTSHPEAPFTDVDSESAATKTAIDGLRKNGIIRGDGNGLYRPGDEISREEFLAILMRVFDIEIKETTANFADVDKNGWYYDTVATAYEMGIVKGYTDGRFGIGDAVTRQDMAVMVCRAMETLNINLDATKKAEAFKDYTDISDYAYHAVAKLQQAGVVNGDDVGKFNPQNNLSRRDAAVVFWSVYVGVNNFVSYSGTIY